MVFIFMIVSCTSRTYQEIQPKINSNTVITYSNQISPIFESKCAGCHDGNQMPNLRNFTEIKDATQNGAVICRIDDQSCGAVMPQTGRMIQQNIDLIKLWKTQGFLE